MRKFACLILVSIIMLLSVPNANARLTILSPEQMLETSDLILVGTVQHKHYTEEYRTITLSIDSTAKGKIDQSQIELQQKKDLKYGWLGFDFPDEGAKVMVLLQRNNQGFSLTGDANSVAVVDTYASVKLYQAATMGKYTPKQYEEAYKAYLKSTSETVKPHHIEHKINTAFNISVVIGIMLVAGFLLIRLRKK